MTDTEKLQSDINTSLDTMAAIVADLMLTGRRSLFELHGEHRYPLDYWQDIQNRVTDRLMKQN